MSKPLRIYLAGGMKSNWQDTVMNVCPMHEYIDPRTHGLTTEDEYTKWDLDGVRGSDLVFAYMDTANPSGFGMSLEVGYAKALEIPVWYVCEDTSERQKYFGMVRACADRKFMCLADAVADLLDFSIDPLVKLTREQERLGLYDDMKPARLTDEQIDAVFKENHKWKDDPWTNWRRFARAIIERSAA